MPISPSRCLVLDNGPLTHRIEIASADRQRVYNINKAMMFGAHREVYSDLNSKGIMKAFNKTVEGAAEKRIREEEIPEIERQRMDELLRQMKR